MYIILYTIGVLLILSGCAAYIHLVRSTAPEEGPSSGTAPERK